MQLLTAETKSTTWRNSRLNVKIVHVFGEIVYFGAKWYFLGGNIIHSGWKKTEPTFLPVEKKLQISCVHQNVFL